ncbi:MAG TPA: sialidase family protein, partial [Chloroflexia bacterium]|nr:sialidase family protein [Chloroflexia bacterium]
MRKNRLVYTLLSLVLLALFALPGNSLAQESSSWTDIGTLPAGTWSLASDGANTSSLYALGSSGIQRSTDRGTNWSTCNRQASTMFVVTPLPGATDHTLLYATTPSGLRLSNDGCATWQDVSTDGIAPSAAHIRWLAPYPNNYSILYAGMDGLGGLYRSTDTGAHWQGASTGLPAGAWVTSLAADPKHPSNVFVSVRYTGRTQPPAYIFASTDGGLTWNSSSKGVYVTPDGDGAVVALAWSGGNLLAATTHDGLYRSTDMGTTWSTSITPRATTGQAATSAPRIDSMSSTPDGVLVLSTSDGAYASINGGQSWQAFGPGETTGKASLLYVDSNSGRVLMSTGSTLRTYVIPQGVTSIPAPSPTIAPSATATPPLPPQVPTYTPIPPSPTSTATATPIPPSP